MPASDRDAARPLPSKRDCFPPTDKRTTSSINLCSAYLLLRPLSRTFDSISTLDHVGFEAYRPRFAMQLQEKSAGVAKHRADFVSSPQGRGRSGAVLAYRLQQATFTVSQCRHGLHLDAIRDKGFGGLRKFGDKVCDTRSPAFLGGSASGGQLTGVLPCPPVVAAGDDVA